MQTGTRQLLYEGHESVRFVDADSPEVVLASVPGKTKLVNCQTGAVRLIPFPLAARRVGKDVLLWTAPDSPTAVWLMRPHDWDTLATWRAN